MPKRKMLSNVDPPKHRIIGDYRHSTNTSKEECLKFLIDKRHWIREHHTFATYKELTLNYRLLFDRRNKAKIVHDYKKYVLSKTIPHISNLTISHNIIKHIGVDEQTEQKIVNFMFDQIKDPALDKYRTIQQHFLRKHFIMEYIKTKYITKEPT